MFCFKLNNNSTFAFKATKQRYKIIFETILLCWHFWKYANRIALANTHARDERVLSFSLDVQLFITCSKHNKERSFDVRHFISRRYFHTIPLNCICLRYIIIYWHQNGVPDESLHINIQYEWSCHNMRVGNVKKALLIKFYLNIILQYTTRIFN